VTENLKINTYVIYTGSTTIYVKSDMYSKKPDDKNWNYKGHTRKGKDSFKVPQMEFDGEDHPKTAKVRQILGNELKDYIIGMNNRLYKQAPNSKESDLIHGLFKKRKCKFNLL
jgi:acyl-CoA hydrolase